MELKVVSDSRTAINSATLAARKRAFNQSLKLFSHTSVIDQLLNVLGYLPDKNYERLAKAFARFASTRKQKVLTEWLQAYMAPGGPGAAYLNRILNDLDPNVRKNYVAQTMAGLFFRDPEVTLELKQKEGVNAPNAIVISPSMRCNISCLGCYAGNYAKKDDLRPDIVDRVITEAKHLGTRYFVITGGEPFFYKPLLDLVEKHHDVTFQVYTNGTLIDKKMAARIVELGNLAPAISIEGFKKETDERRGPGTFEKIMQAMDHLREQGAIFAFSTTASRKNIDTITSNKFVEMLIDKGCMYGWYFSYIPIGKTPDLSYMPSPEERNRLREGVNRIRNELPIMVADFWNDGTLTGGCLAAGRKYLHINNRGDVEPCVFCHFATDNINEVSLLEALKSPFFGSIRKRQPFGHNLLRPCPIIDHPDVLREVVRDHCAYPTHNGAETVITDLRDDLDSYAHHLEEVSDEVWSAEYGWAQDWLTDEHWADADRAEAIKSEKVARSGGDGNGKKGGGRKEFVKSL